MRPASNSEAANSTTAFHATLHVRFQPLRLRRSQPKVPRPFSGTLWRSVNFSNGAHCHPTGAGPSLKWDSRLDRASTPCLSSGSAKHRAVKAPAAMQSPILPAVFPT